MITFLGSVSCYMYGGGEPGTRMSFACGIYKWPLVMPMAVSLPREAHRDYFKARFKNKREKIKYPES